VDLAVWRHHVDPGPVTNLEADDVVDATKSMYDPLPLADLGDSGPRIAAVDPVDAGLPRSLAI
jgi:hypothetical protein